MKIVIGMTYILYGILTIVLTHAQPIAYWNNRYCRFWRNLIGDRATITTQSSIGVILIFVGNFLLS